MTPDGKVNTEAAVDLRDEPAAAGDIDVQVAALLSGDATAHSEADGSKAHRLAKTLATEGRVDEAVALYRRAVTIRQATLGPSHPDVATTLHNLALLLETTGRADEARFVWAQARAVLESVGQSPS